MSTYTLLAIVVIFATLASAWAAAVRSAALRRKFEQLGRIKGRTMEEVLRHAGPPTRRDKLFSGNEVLLWRRINFRIALTFVDGVCNAVDFDTNDTRQDKEPPAGPPMPPGTPGTF